MAVKKRTTELKEKQIEAVLAMMHGGKPMVTACDLAGVPSSTFCQWMSDEKYSELYVRAREALVDRMAAETMAIADAPVGCTDNGSTDSGAVQKQRLQVDTRKWLLSKLAPKKYGDRIEVAGDKDNPLMVKVENLTDEELARIAATARGR